MSPALHAEWALSAPHLLKQSQRAAQMTSARPRFEGEMLEISETYSNAGLPDALHAGAAEVHERMALKDLPPPRAGVPLRCSGRRKNNRLLRQLPLPVCSVLWTWMLSLNERVLIPPWCSTIREIDPLSAPLKARAKHPLHGTEYAQSPRREPRPPLFGLAWA